MNREIKFRLWCGESNKMIYQVGAFLPFPIPTGDEFKPLYVGARLDGDASVGWGKFQIMEFTGLKDKNGKEIYEGDIIETPEHYEYSDYPFPASIGVVNFNNCSFGVFDETNEYMDLWETINNYGGIVIGNCFENREMLGD